jgi:glycosyltransferase involved in cell wall biosynthesis
MKVAFAIDFLLERNQEVFLLELLLAGFPDAEIYTLAHAKGKILGRIENHKIISSPLSRFVQSFDHLKKTSWMIPSAINQLRISPDVDKLIILSSGWAHTFESNSKTERFVWLSHFSYKTNLLGWKKVFKYHHQNLQIQTLKHEKNLAFSSQSFKNDLRLEGRVIYPGYKTEDFHLVADEIHTGNYTHHLVHLKGADPQLIRSLAEAALKTQIPLKFVGPDEAYSDLKQPKNFEFIGDHCNATTAAMTHDARAVWSFYEGFPAQALGALACGRPAVVLNTPENQEVLSTDAVWFYQNNMPSLLAEVDQRYLSADKKVLRRMGLRYNERLFKNQFRAWAKLVVNKED